ncbi:SigE family RNA polymerase sigma factor [Streptomyces umbrinus]|uniref:SigE family RNA polymerase sigma factor n=1 Tax=Streptomyces umbrinus TaxID=67370 RepID=UPI003C30D595
MFISKAPERAGSSFDDSHGFDAFYTSTAKRMVATVYAMTGDLAEAEDAVQEAYVRAWQRWRGWSGGGDPLPWVRTVAMRLAISAWRRTRGRLRAHFRHGPQADVPELSADRVALVVALRELSPDQRQAVILHHLLDLPVEQVARETGASSGAVRTRLSRARRILGERLAEADSAFASKGVAGHG